MHAKHSSNSVELHFDQVSSVYTYCTDSEPEWGVVSHSRESSAHNKSRDSSIDKYSLREPAFNNADDLEHQLHQLSPLFKARKRHVAYAALNRRFVYEDERFPPHATFLHAFEPSIGLYKRDNLNEEEAHETTVHSRWEAREDIESLESEYERADVVESKPFSRDNASTNSRGSECTTLKINGKTFDSNCNNKQKKLKHLRALYDTLCKCFKGQVLERGEVQLQSHELTILSSIIKRKFKNKVRFAAGDDFFISDKLNEVHERGSNKRAEECYKFIFKRAIKAMRDEFKCSRARKSSKCELEQQFYEHYFGDIARKEEISLQSFYQPTNSLKQREGMPKTINAEYMTNICKSGEFTSKFLRYAYSQLKIDYERVIESKLDCLVHKWDTMFDVTNTDEQQVTNAITTYIEKNRKCKLPWSSVEVDEALVALRKLFKEHTLEAWETAQ